MHGASTGDARLGSKTGNHRALFHPVEGKRMAENPFRGHTGVVAQIHFGSDFPFPRTESGCGLRDGCSESREAVEDRGTDVKLSDLAVEVA